MLKIGLTGGIGSGKSTVAKLFKELKVPVIDTDEIAREIVLPGKQAYNTAIAHFGAKILDASGNINRKILREIIFNNPTERMWLEQTLHPLIIHETLQQLEKLDRDNLPYCIVVIPLLAENPSVQQYIDHVLLVDCSEETQIARTMLRDHIPVNTAIDIIKTQASREERLAIADDIINNENIELEALQRSVLTLHKKYLAHEKKHS